MPPRLVVHAESVVGDNEPDILARRHVPRCSATLFEKDVRGFDGEHAARRHGVSGIQAEVQHDPSDLGRVCFDQTGVGIQSHGDLDPLVQQSSKHLFEIGDDGIQIERSRLQDLPTAEREQLIGQRRRSRRRRADLGHLIDRPPIEPRRVGKEIGVADDHGQQVVEVVGDPAGQPADGLHLLALPALLFAEVQRLFRRALTCDVLDGQQH